MTVAEYLEKLEEFAKAGDIAGSERLAEEHLAAVRQACSAEESWQIDVLMRDVYQRSGMNEEQR